MTDLSRVLLLGALAVLLASAPPAAVPRREGPPAVQSSSAADEFYDSHFHLTSYVQKGIDVRQVLEIMGARVGRRVRAWEKTNVH